MAERPTILGAPVVLHRDGRASAKTALGGVYLTPCVETVWWAPGEKVSIRLGAHADRMEAIERVDRLFNALARAAQEVPGG